MIWLPSRSGHFGRRVRLGLLPVEFLFDLDQRFTRYERAASECGVIQRVSVESEEHISCPGWRVAPKSLERVGELPNDFILWCHLKHHTDGPGVDQRVSVR